MGARRRFSCNWNSCACSCKLHPFSCKTYEMNKGPSGGESIEVDGARWDRGVSRGERPRAWILQAICNCVGLAVVLKPQLFK